MGPSPAIVTKSQLRVSNGGQIEAAYRWSDLFERRRVLMEDWAEYLNGHRGIEDIPRA